MGKKAKRKAGHAGANSIDRALTTPEARAQVWEQRTRAAQQLHESRQRAQGAFRRNAKVDAAMQQLLSTTEDPRGPLGLATHYQTHSQWTERPRGGLVRYNGTPDYMASTDEWLDHLQRVLAGWSLDPPPKGSGHGTDAAPPAAGPHEPGATGGLGDVDVGALGRARARLLAEEPTLSFVFESCCMAGLAESEVGARLGLHRGHVNKQKFKALRYLRAWVGGNEPDERGSVA